MTGYLEAEYAHTKKSRFPTALAEFLKTKLDMSDVMHVSDIGAGTGDYLEPWKRFGRGLLAVDRENGVRSMYHETIDWAYWDFVSELGGTTDLIICKSVIEHMRDPVGFVKSIAGRTQQLVLICPDFETCYLDFYDDPTHITPMTLKGLEQTVIMAGYKVHSSGRFAQTPFLVNKPALAALLRLLIPKRFGRWVLRRFGIDWFRRASQLACYVVVRHE